MSTGQHALDGDEKEKRFQKGIDA